MTEVKITLGNSYSKIQGLTTEQFNKLKKVLSYAIDPQAAYFSGGFYRRKYLIDKVGSFPTGLVGHVRKFLDKNNISFKSTPWPAKPVPTEGMFTLSLPYEPHEWQLKAAEEAVYHQRGGIIAPTGTGKSIVIALIASGLNVRTLVVVPTVEIKKQLQEALNAYFGSTDNIIVENIDSRNLRKEQNFDCLIIDECHHVAARTYQVLNKKYWKNIYHRYFLTATWGRNNRNENLLFEGIAGEAFYRLTYKEAVKNGYIVPVEAYYIDLPKKQTEAFTYVQVYSELIVNNTYRNELIAQLLNNLKENNIYTLCLVKEIAHGNNISKISSVPFVNGKDEESRPFIRQFNNGGLMAIIGTTGILGEGVDTKPAEFVILAGLGKARSAILQQIGRGVRTYPGKDSCKVVLFRDTSHKFTLRHFKEQCKILREEFGIVPTKLEII